MADVKWIKITTDIFDDEKILLIESLPDAYAIITVWFKLLCLAGKQNNSGVFLLGRIPYTDKMLATIFRMKESTVTLALQTFEQFGMVELVDGVITIPNWNKHQSLDAYEKKKAYDRQYRMAQREKQKQLAEGSNDCQTSSRTTVVVPDKEEDKDKEKEIDKDISMEPAAQKTSKPVKHKYGEYKNVLLTDDELGKLKSEYSDWQERIERLSSYVASTGKTYKSHYATIRNWARKDNESGKRTEMVPKWMNKQPDYNPTPERVKKNGDWLDGFLEEQKQADLQARAEQLKQRIGG